MSNIFNLDNLRKLNSMRSRYTLKELYTKTREKLTSPHRHYEYSYQEYLPSEEELDIQRRNPLDPQPLVSIIVPAYETPELFLRQMVDSVIAQTYGNWELCIADGSGSKQVEQVIEEYQSRDQRVRYFRLAENGGISENTNQGFEHARGEYLALLDHDDLLVPSALYEMVGRANETGADLLYSDEDKVTGNLERYQDPHFKLDYNLELLLANNYICHFLMFTRKLLEEAGGLDSRYDGAQDFDFVLRCTEKARRVEHVARILYHWRIHEGSTAGRADSKLYAYEAGRRAVEAALERQGQQGSVTMIKDYGFYRIAYPVPKDVTLEIQAWGKPSASWRKLQRKLGQELLGAGVEPVWREVSTPGLWVRNSGRILEMGIDGGVGQEISVETVEQAASVEPSKSDFVEPSKSDSVEPSKATSVECSKGAYMLRINRAAVKLETEDVLRLLGSCARPGIGAVSARVLSGGRVRNCGFYKKKGAYCPRFANLPADFKGYFCRGILAAEVEAVGNDLAVFRLDRTAGRILVEPAAEVALR